MSLEKPRARRAVAFARALDDLRRAFPEVYIEAWTPDDFKTNFPAEGTLAWNSTEAIRMAELLYDHFDANNGTSWGSLDAVRLFGVPKGPKGATNSTMRRPR